MTVTPLSPPLLTVDALRIETEEGKVLVDNVSFTLRAGDTLGIVGESGSGKSLTCRAVLGVLPTGLRVTAGRIRFDGQDLLRLDRRGWAPLRGVRLSAIFQDPGSYLNPSIPVGRQIAEALRATSRLSRAQARAEAIALLHSVGIHAPTIVYRQYPFELSGGMLQRVLIAIAVSAKPDLLIADEPTTALDVTIQSEILALLAALQRDHKLALVIVSHDLAVITQIADTILVMRDGQVVEAGTTANLMGAATHSYTRSLLEHQDRYTFARASTDAPVQPLDAAIALHHPPLASALLHVDAIDVAYGRGSARRTILQSVSLAIAQGESIGLIGETGSGKTTLLRTILGLVRPGAGAVYFDGARIDTLDRYALREFRRSGAIQYAFQDPLQSLDPDITAARSVGEGLRLRGGLAQIEVEARVARALRDVGLDPQIAARRPAELSGGQRQRVVLARALALDPKLLLLDEPVSALDSASRAQILDLLVKLGSDHGIARIFVSHDLGSVAATTDRIAVLYRGQVVEFGSTASVLREPRHPYTRTLLAAAPSLPGLYNTAALAPARPLRAHGS